MLKKTAFLFIFILIICTLLVSLVHQNSGLNETITYMNDDNKSASIYINDYKDNLSENQEEDIKDESCNSGNNGTEEPEKVLSTNPISKDSPLYEFTEKYIEIAVNEPRNPQNEKGWTKYGAYFGDGYAQWCTEYAIWCIIQADKELGTDYVGKVFPDEYSAYRCVRWHKKNKTLNMSGEYIPRKGDLIYFDYDLDKNCDHTGLVTGVEYNQNEDKIYVLTIEGNLPEDYPNGVIRERRLEIDSSFIYGYGSAYEG